MYRIKFFDTFDKTTGITANIEKPEWNSKSLEDIADEISKSNSYIVSDGKVFNIIKMDKVKFIQIERI